MIFSVTALLLASTAFGHFVLTSPPSRGFDEDVESEGPCGSFNTTSSTRYPLFVNSAIGLEIADKGVTVNVFVAAGANPTVFTTRVGNANYTAQENYDLVLDLTAAKLVNGSAATIQVIVNGPDGMLYQCADITVNTALTNSTTAVVYPKTTPVASVAAPASSTLAPSAAATTAPPKVQSGATSSLKYGVIALPVVLLL